MAYNLRFWYEYKDISDTLNRVEILYNGYAGDSYEVIAGATPFVPSINEGEGNKGGEIIDTLFSLQAVTSSQFNIEAFDSEAYGDVIFKYYHDSVLKYHGVIDAFETNQELLPNGTTVLILSAESGIKNLGKVYLKNSDDTAISGKVRIIEVIAKALRLLNAQNTANIVSIVNTSVYEGSTQVNADKDLFENITNIETFQNDNGEILTAYEAIKRCLGGIYTLKYFENQWYIEHIEAYTQASYYKTVYDYSGTRISRTSVTRTLKSIFEGDILRGGTEGKLFSKGKIVVKRNINSLISSLPNSDFEPIGSQLVHWTGVSSLSNSILGGYGTVDQPFYLQINGSVYDNTTPDTEFVESGSFNWYPYGRSDFANRPDANMYDEDEKLKFNLKNEYGSGISGARVQIMATYAFMDEDTQMPTMTPGTEEDISFTTFTYYYTNNGWSLDPGFYVTGNNAIESIEVDPPAVNRMGYFRYRSANTGTYYLKSPPTVSVKIRLFRGARLKIGASTNEESGYTYFVRYFRVTSSVWTQDEEILQSKVEKTYLTANNTDRLGNVDIGLDMYYPLYPYAFGSIFKDSSTNTPISGYKKPGESTIQAYDLFVGQSYLRRNSSRLHRMYIIKKSFDVSPDTLLTYDSKVYRIVKYDFNQRHGNCDMTILEVLNNGVAISEKVSVSENQTVLDSSYKKVIYPPKAGDDRIKVDKYGNISLNHELNNITSFNKSGGYINLQKEDNEESSGVYFTNADGTMAQAMTPSAIGFDFKSDLNNFKVELDLSELTKDVKVATDDSAWMLGGNDLVTKAFIGGKAGNFDLGVKRNNIEVATFVSSGISLPQMAAVTTDTNKFVVNDSGVLKYQSGANVLKHITDALTAGYIPKADATLGLTNSILYSASNGVAIGTTTPLLSLEVNNISSDTYSRPSIGGRSADKSRWGYLLAPINGGTMVDLIRSNNTNFRIATESVLGGGTFTNQFYINSNGSVGIGTSGLTGFNLRVNKPLTGNGGNTAYGIGSDGVIQNDVTTAGRYFFTTGQTAASTTLTHLVHYETWQGTLGAGSVVSYQTGFWARESLTGASNNYGFRGNIASATNRWNNFHDGTAQNYFAGNTGIGYGRSVPITALDVNGQVSVSLGFASAPAYTFFGDLNNGWFSPTADTQAWSVGGSEVMRLSSAGSLGIGVTPAYKLDVNGTGHFTGAVTFDTVPSSLVDATSANHLVRYSQWISSTAVKYLPTAVKTVSLSNITLSGTQTVSGVALVAGDRILVAGQTTQSENGIYVVAAGAWSRATDSDTDTELRGFIVSVSNGTYSGYKYINTNQSTITVGTTAVTYAEFSNLSEIDPVFIAWRDLSRTANTVLASPNGSAGAASFRSLVTADIPSLDWSKITTGKPTTLSGYGITDAQSVLNGTGYVKMSGTTLSYINKEFVDTTTDQTIYGQKIFRDSFKVGNSLFNIQTGQPDTVDNDLKFDFITDATSFNYSISDIDDNIGTLFSIQGNFVGTNIRTDISTDLYIYRIVDSNLSTGTNKQILRTDSSGILNWTTIDGSYISNWATKQDALNGTGFVKANGTTITYDNSTYLSTSVAATTYQPLDADLTSISALTGDGVLRKVSNVWNLDTDMYLTTDTKIYFIATATQVGLVNPGTTLTVNGLGNLNLKSGIVTTGTYRSVTVDTYGRVTAGTNPTTVVGYGLTDVWTKTESDARYLLQSSYNPTWGQLTGSPIDNTAFNSTMLGYVNTSTTQTGIAGSKTFTSAMYANGTLTTNQLFVKDTTGGNAYPLSIVNALTYNGWSGSSLIKSGLDIYNDYKPLVFLGSHFMMLRGSLKLGGNSVGATGTVDFATERLDITGNIRYSGTLKPSNIAGTGWLYSNGTNDSWKLITPSDIFELSSFTGFDSRYYTKTEISDIIASTIPNGTSGHFLTRDSGGDLTFMNIDIDPVRLSSNKIAVGSPQGILTEVSGFEFVDKRYLSISRKGFADQKITIGHLPNSQHALFDVQGGRMELNSNVGIRLNPLAGTGTRMLVVNATGDISAQDIPSGGSGSNYLPYRRVPYGSAENTQTSDDSLRFYSSVLESELKLGISTPLSFRSDNTGYNNYIQSIGGYINMSSNRISLLVSASGQPNSGEIELSSYHNTLIHSGYGDVIINATEGDVIIKGGAVEWVTTTINGQTRQILCKKL